MLTNALPATLHTETPPAKATCGAAAVHHAEAEDTASRAGFRLLVETSEGAETRRADGATLEALVVAPHARVLVGAASGKPRLASDAGSDALACARLETVAREGRPALLLAAPPQARVRVNGAPAAPLGVLTVGDVLEQHGVALHVSWQHIAEVGSAPAHALGRTCPVCQTPIDATQRVIEHPCGTFLHLAESADELQCALFGNCPTCERRVSLESGLTYHPEI